MMGCTGHAAAGLTALALVLTGCSSEPEADISTVAAEYEFSPDGWTVSAGEEFSIQLTNDGAADHEWAVIGLGQDIASEDDFTEDKVLLEVEAIAAGSSTTESFTIDEAGTYQVICAIPGHFDQGMEATLVVE